MSSPYAIRIGPNQRRRVAIWIPAFPGMTRRLAVTSPIPREAIAAKLAEAGYVADRDLSTALWMMDHLHRPLLIEGEAGVGKTEVAKALATVHGCELIRMQCYEGLDVNSALYEWNYQRQLQIGRASCRERV